ncbi:hypothetical protein LA080_002697 [Diaporthe eres]|nr:hypothetical protein LA080_002697 [Diaporthe eres]
MLGRWWVASILLRQVKRQVGPDKEDTQKRGSVNRLQLETGRIVKRRNDRRGTLEMIQRCSRIRAAPGDDGDDPGSTTQDF